ncbi:PepSY-associated TM helix domain-containing protein [Nocardia fluminea]|uniref:Putative iron-regulated membrane protein n=1 Tax=Nocardia fluminea TaxID=134984 RepID=A0A2N3VDI7_9NOCA|nr:PepSY domain-containing protein [Nocardia fluminea]PKV79676.1 putative iron-regulated membrane protein [Nocardia fluminea]
MTLTDLSPSEEQASPEKPVSGDRPRGPRRSFNLYPLAMRLHFYAGIFVAPFILIAAITGALYAISPTLEQIVSRDLLEVQPSGPVRPLGDQVTAAAATKPELTLVAVAPSAEGGQTTRVIFNDPSLGKSERLSVFVDPSTAQPVGEAVVYGSSGALPLRAWISELHRSLHLGDFDRLYSELAASWLWIIASFGLVLWVIRVRKRRARRSAQWLLAPDLSKAKQRTVNWHAAVGVWILPVLLLLSATGVTWSTYGGANVTELRQQLSWTTPSVSAKLPGVTAAPASGGHGDHSAPAPAAPPVDQTTQIAQLDRVYEAARAEGVTQAAEIAVPAGTGTAFLVKERRMPGTYTIDAVAVDGSTGTVTDTLAFADWPIMAKLTNWGIAFHMGLLFGVANQLLLLAVALGLITVIVLGYLMWWKRRPTKANSRFAMGKAPRRGALRRTSLWVTVPLAAAAGVVGWFLPVLGLSLLAFLVLDAAVAVFRFARDS